MDLKDSGQVNMRGFGGRSKRKGEILELNYNSKNKIK